MAAATLVGNVLTHGILFAATLCAIPTVQNQAWMNRLVIGILLLLILEVIDTLLMLGGRRPSSDVARTGVSDDLRSVWTADLREGVGRGGASFFLWLQD